MLDYPSGTLSWIPLIDFDDKNAIVAAIIPEIGTNWVCRANLEDKLIPGVYVLGGNCYVPLGEYSFILYKFLYSLILGPRNVFPKFHLNFTR